MATIEQARLELMHKYWNAVNYLTVGQIYLLDNPLLKEPLRRELPPLCCGPLLP